MKVIDLMELLALVPPGLTVVVGIWEPNLNDSPVDEFEPPCEMGVKGVRVQGGNVVLAL